MREGDRQEKRPVLPRRSGDWEWGSQGRAGQGRLPGGGETTPGWNPKRGTAVQQGVGAVWS